MADTSWLGSLKGSAAEAKSRLAEDAAQRAAEGKRPDNIILNQRDVLTGKWDAVKTLKTTLGGIKRDITADDLVAFRSNIDTVKNKFSRGITAKQVIDLSHDIVDGTAFSVYGVQKSDLDRARTEITMAVPVSATKGRVRFITNAGPDSDVSRHHIIVEFMNYGAEAASGAADPRKSAIRLRHGPLAIECDCERWRYWFRYIATIGQYNAGRPETGFPKVRNPRLQNVACKHLVRVMSEINSGGATLGFLTKLMDKAKRSDDAKAQHRNKQAEAEQLIRNQAKRTTGNEIKTSEQKRADKLAAQSRKSATHAVSSAVKPKKAKSTSTNTGSADKREAKLRAYMAKLGLEPTQEQVDKVRNNVK